MTAGNAVMDDPFSFYDNLIIMLHFFSKYLFLIVLCSSQRAKKPQGVNLKVLGPNAKPVGGSPQLPCAIYTCIFFFQPQGLGVTATSAPPIARAIFKAHVALGPETKYAPI